EDDALVPLLFVDGDRVGLVDELAREVREQLAHRYLEMPCVLSSRATASVGCAPLPSQSFTFASSRSIVDGSVCGLYRPTMSRNFPSRGARASAATTR